MSTRPILSGELMGGAWLPVSFGRVAVCVGALAYLIFIMEAMFGIPNPAWAVALLAAAVVTAALASQLTRPLAGRILDWLDTRSAVIVMAMIVAMTVLWGGASILQAWHFALGAHAEDTAYYSQLLWNTLQGNPLAGNVQQERLYNPPVSSDLALHVSPALGLLLPLYALAPHFLTLLIVRDIALAAAAWPLYALTRERMGGSVGIAAAGLYLVNPAVVAQGFEAFYLLHFAPLPFFLALRAFARQDLRWFGAWIVLAMSLREDVAIGVAGFGLLALVTRRPFRWTLLGLGLPVAWWLVCTMLVQPAFGHWGNNVTEIAYSGGDRAKFGIYQVLLSNPLGLLDLLRQGGFEYLYRLLRSVGFLALLGWEGVLAAPGLAANLLVGRMLDQAVDPMSRLALMPACALIGASVLTTTRVAGWVRDRGRARIVAVVMLTVLPSVSLLDGIKDSAQERLAFYTVSNDGPALRTAVGQVPPGAAVAAPNYALPALASREKLYYLQYLHMYPGARPDYILVDRDVDRVTSNPDLRKRYTAFLAAMLETSDYDVAWRSGPYLLFRRHEGTGGLPSRTDGGRQ